MIVDGTIKTEGVADINGVVVSGNDDNDETMLGSIDSFVLGGKVLCSNNEFEAVF